MVGGSWLIVARENSLVQWVPKTATSQFPEKRRSLRELWSPEERESDASSRDIFYVTVAVAVIRGPSEGGCYPRRCPDAPLSEASQSLAIPGMIARVKL